MADRYETRSIAAEDLASLLAGIDPRKEKVISHAPKATEQGYTTRWSVIVLVKSE